MAKPAFKLVEVAPLPLKRRDDGRHRINYNGPVPDEVFMTRDDWKRSNLSPRWRWVQAGLRLEGVSALEDYQPPPGIDETVLALVMPFRYLEPTLSSTEDGKDELFRKFPEMYWAWQVFQSTSRGRWMLEALICADEPRAKIAEYMKVKSDAVAVYELVFFDARRRLDDRNWMCNELFPGVYREHGALNFEAVFWKMLGWKHGLGARVLYLLSHASEKPSAELANAIEGMRRKELAIQALQAQLSRIPNNFNAHEITEEYQQLVEFEQNKGRDSTEADSQFSKLARAFQESIQLARKGQELPAVEPRAYEEYAAAVQPEPAPQFVDMPYDK